jgi:hypothetical protein
VQTYRRKYGIDWEPHLTDPFIDLVAAKHWREEPYCHGNLLAPGEHLLRACRALLTRDQFTISPWTEEHAQGWAGEDFLLIWGGASCSKSNDIGLFGLLDWITDPHDTLVAMVSTTRAMLALRSYESVQRYFRILKKHPVYAIPGKDSKTAMAIINDEDVDDEATVKASVRGVAVQQGTVEESRANLQGAHMPYVSLILDEGEAIREAAYDARTNLSIGARRFRFVILANPESFTGMTARFAEPVNGWTSVNENTTSWRSVYGLCMHHNGFASPSLTEKDGARKYPYLISQKQIDRVIAEEHGNADSPRVYTMLKGWPAPQGISRGVLTEQEAIAFNACEQPVWANEEDVVRLAALDPAFTADGDGCVLRTATLGRVRSGVAVLAYDPPFYVPIMASSSRPVTYQIVDAVRTELLARNVPIGNLACDDSGTQSVADVLTKELGVAVFRCNFAEKASDKPITTLSGDPASMRCKNMVTEAWMILAEFVRHGQVRGLSVDDVRQLTQRLFRRGEAAATARALETKREFKKRTGMASPDEADAASMIALLARDRFGFTPGGAPGAVAASMPPIAGSMPMHDLSKRFRSNYVASPSWNKLRSYLRRT